MTGMSLSLNPRAALTPFRLVVTGLRLFREGWKEQPRLIRSVFYAAGWILGVSTALSWLARVNERLALWGLGFAVGLLILGFVLDLWRIGFRMHAQHAVDGWRGFIPGNRLWALPYRRMFAGTRLAFTSPKMYGHFRDISNGSSERFVRLVRAAHRSGAVSVFKRAAPAFAEAVKSVPDADLEATMKRLVAHARQNGVADVQRYLKLPLDTALAGLDAGVPFEYAEAMSPPAPTTVPKPSPLAGFMRGAVPAKKLR
jgi:hypothetical protein